MGERGGGQADYIILRKHKWEVVCDKVCLSGVDVSLL